MGRRVDGVSSGPRPLFYTYIKPGSHCFAHLRKFTQRRIWNFNFRGRRKFNLSPLIYFLQHTEQNFLTFWCGFVYRFYLQFINVWRLGEGLFSCGTCTHTHYSLSSLLLLTFAYRFYSTMIKNMLDGWARAIFSEAFAHTQLYLGHHWILSVNFALIKNSPHTNNDTQQNTTTQSIY